jgi:hypothetical protein
MAVIWAAVIAVLGTLGGVTATYYFQSRASQRSETIAREERWRQERLAACSAFAGAVMDFRGAQHERVLGSLSGRARADRSVGIVESSCLRSIAWSSYYRFKLTSPGEGLCRLAEQVVEETADLSDAEDEADLKRRSEQARRRLQEFSSAAASDLAGTTQPQEAS